MVEKALLGIRAFLESKSCYDILPESFRLIVFDNKLSITRSLQALVTNGPLFTHFPPPPRLSQYPTPSCLMVWDSSYMVTDPCSAEQESFRPRYTIPPPNASPECLPSPTSSISSSTTTSPRTSTKTSSPK